jgi:CelD/BcsL family acetyltransferase involved in cellulose biosynthesis
MHGSPALATSARCPERARGCVHTQALDTLDALEQLQPEWEALWARAEAATPFQSPHWLLPWWKHVGQGRLASLALRSADDGELVGLAPFYIYTDAATGTRHLFPIGIATTDVLDVLVQRGWEDTVLAAIAAHLQETRDAWDVFEAPQLRPGAHLLGLELPPDWHSEVAAAEPNPVLALPRPDAWSAVPRAMRENVRYCRRRVQRSQSVSYEVATRDQLDAFLAALARLHARRWSERGEAGVLAGSVLGAHRECVPLLHAAGLLRLHGVRLDGELVAVAYVLADAHRSYFYLGGFEPALRTLSPGTLAIAHAIDHAIATGAAAFDFLRGAEPYKYRWGAIDQPMSILRVHPAGRRAPLA